jgi:putative hydrolase of the HAD superfamily
MLIRAALFDLDDTLYAQAEWLGGAWRAVAKTAAAFGLDPARLEPALRAVCAEGSDRGRIIDRALARVGAHEIPIRALVDAFRGYAPPSLPPYPGVPEALEQLRGELLTGLISDGDVLIQQAKIQALGLAGAFDAIVLSDAFGRQWRKPHAFPFEAALDKLGVRPAEAVYIGDRPDKDVAGASAAGIRTIRVLTGEYAGAANRPAAWRVAAGVVDAIEMVRWARRHS